MPNLARHSLYSELFGLSGVDFVGPSDDHLINPLKDPLNDPLNSPSFLCPKFKAKSFKFKPILSI